MSATSYCPTCGVELWGDPLFCYNCDIQLRDGGSDYSAPLPYLISPSRIVFLSFLSFGLYLAYWLYKTWEHYRDHTGAEAYPIWHGLTLFVPVYNSFRAHAHIRIFGELSDRARVYLGFNPTLALAIVFVGSMLSILLPGFMLTAFSVALRGDEIVPVIDPFTGRQPIDPDTGLGLTKVVNPTAWELIRSLLLRIVSITAGIWMLLHAQPRMNYYWNHVYGSRMVEMEVGKGEVLIGFLGALAWILIIRNILFAQWS